MLKVDLHVHSSFSDRHESWLLRRAGMPQSYTEPETLYRKLDAAGMTYKTITDHDTIDGCKAIAHHLDVFISEEVTTFFPDGCKVHLLVWNITESQHHEIQKLRRNIFELSAYLRQQQISHAVAHALAGPDSTFTVNHFEKLLLLFKTFEGRTSGFAPLALQTLEIILNGLTPQKIQELAGKHNLAPTHPNPHQKVLIAGSNDHSGIFPAKNYTQAAKGEIVRDFFDALENGNVETHGPYGDSLELSTSLYSSFFNFAITQLGKKSPSAAFAVHGIGNRFLAGKNPLRLTFGERLALGFHALKTGQLFKFAGTSLSGDITRFLASSQTRDEIDFVIANEPDVSRRSFKMASHLVNQLSARLAQQFMKRLGGNDPLSAAQSLAGLLPVAGAMLPYLTAFRKQAPDRKLLKNCSVEITGKIPTILENSRRAWFTDTLEDINGVARTIRAMARAAKAAEADLTVITSASSVVARDFQLKNFTPVQEFQIPEYELQKISFPPLLEILDYIQRENFTEIIISTPGPVGLCGLFCAELFNLPVSGIYHTDFPQYARYLSDDPFMESLVWSFMHWFYSRMDTVYVNSDHYRRSWAQRGIPPEKLKIFPRGLDTALFNPKHRDTNYWSKRGAKGPVVLYVGRISKEKELAFLADVLVSLRDKAIEFTPAFVGEGPYRAELETRLPGAIFTGPITGAELGTAYASADLFVFPSITDTFGNVVIEAMAAGLPVIVSDVGGPRELVHYESQGQALPARQIEPWATAISQRLQNPRTDSDREKMANIIREERDWGHAFRKFWAHN